MSQNVFLSIVFLSSLGPLLSGQDRETSPATDDRDSVTKELQDLRKRLGALEAKSGSQSDSYVDLAPAEVSPPLNDAAHPLARPWYQKFDIWGFGAVDLIATGPEGTKPRGGFVVKEASLFVEAHAWENTSFFIELQTNRLGKDNSLFVRTGEVYVHLRDILQPWDGPKLGLKAGRIDIPFGEEYLWQDSIDNPLVSNSAAYPYGWDEGLLLYGDIHGLGWIAAVTDGTDERSVEDHWDKAVNLKLHGKPIENLHLSASFMRNGKSAESGLEFGGSHLQPVGAEHVSSAGASPSERVDSYLYELDAKIDYMQGSYVAFSFGQAFIDDRVSRFDRQLIWFSVEALQGLTSSVYAVLRYSEIGTYSSSEGYHFDGKPTAGGNSAFGYDARRFQRLAFGLGWNVNPQLLLKGEVGYDRFDVIDASPFTPNGDNRILGAIEVVVSF